MYSGQQKFLHVELNATAAAATLCEATERDRRATGLDTRVARLDLRTGGRLAR